jgi:hypothetical protein
MRFLVEAAASLPVVWGHPLRYPERKRSYFETAKDFNFLWREAENII